MARNKSAGSETRHRYLFSIIMGMAATALAAVLHYSGIDRRAELNALDLRLNYAAVKHPRGPAVHVDIDDGSLERVGRWPWPRSMLAGMIREMKACGARAAVLDIMLPHPQKVRYVSEADSVYAPSESELVSSRDVMPVFDDMVLAEEIQKAGNVYMGMQLNIGGDARATGGAYAEIRDAVNEALHEHDVASLEALIGELSQSLGEKLNQNAVAFAAQEYLRLRAMDELRQYALPVNTRGVRTRSRLLPGGEMIPPLLSFTRGLKGVGFVNAEPDADGIFRRMRLLARYDDAVYMQLSLAAARDTLARRHAGFQKASLGNKQLALSFGDGEKRRIPLDEDGMMIINWDTADTRHIPASLPASIYLLKQSLDRNIRLKRITAARLAQVLDSQRNKTEMNAFKELILAANGVSKLIEQRRSLQRRYYKASLYGSGNRENICGRLLAVKAAEAAGEQQLDKMIETLIEDVSFFLKSADTVEDDNPQRIIIDTCSPLKDRLDEIETQNAEIRKDVNILQSRLAAVVNGNICLVGSSSTGAADFAPTPLGKRMPGIHVHYHLLNTILSGRFISRAPLWLDALAIVLAGLLVSLITATRPIIRAAFLTLLLALTFIAINALVVFRTHLIWMTMVAPLAAILLSFLYITMYRQLTEEREKRKIKGMFANTLSPALVDRLIEDPSLAEVGGENRTLTCMFSDLAGFTAMSERLGPQETVTLLNRYFDRMTEIVQIRRGGYLNKFLGDGIFVFFGAPVFQEDHPARGVIAAVECREGAADFNRELAAETGSSPSLRVRIGLTTGEVMVGNYGSSQRYDYTAIGDPVNLASRLESSCKFFGAGIICDDRTWREGGSDEIVSRPLGRIYISGVTEAVAVHEILGRRDSVPKETMDTISLFADAVTAIDNRAFDTAGKLLEEVIEKDADDTAARLYRDFCRAHTVLKPGAPPPEVKDPNGVVRLRWIDGGE